MGFFEDLFGKRPYPAQLKPEIDKIVEELVSIGKRDDFLSEHPGGPFNMHCRHIRAREIGKRLNEIGGVELMDFIQRRIAKRLDANLAAHLSYAWTDIGKWIP